MKVVAIFSGGMDSTVLLHHLISGGHDVSALSVDYGQRHRIELQHAYAIADKLGIRHEVADLRGITHLLAASGSSQVSDKPVPQGHYASDTMKQTVVPNRNMIMLSVAVGWAISIEATVVAYGAHEGDHTIYPDCREEFAQALNLAIKLCDWHDVELWRPFVALTKADIVRRGSELEVDFGATWSCYEGGEVHCGACGTCYERREAFKDARVIDLTAYRSKPEFSAP